MTGYESWTLTIQWLQLAVQFCVFLTVLVTAIYVAVQLRGSLHDRVVAQMFDMDQVFITHPHMRKYFYDGEAIAKDDKDYDRAVAIAEMRLDFFDHIVSPDRLYSKFWSTAKWNSHIVGAFANAPVMCEYLASRLPDSYSVALVALMKRGCEGRRTGDGAGAK